MRFGWRLRFGPFWVGQTWRKRRQRDAYRAVLPGWKCRHAHRTRGAAEECLQREQRRRLRGT